jgi:hypothetical protein
MDNGVMENDYYSDGSEKPKSLVGRIGGWIGLAIIVLVMGLIFFRIYIQKVPSAAAQFIWTADTLAAYQEDADSLKIYTQELTSYNYPTGKDANGQMEYERITYNTITSDGTFQVSDLVYIPSTKELQITVRYNRLAISKVMEAYSLSEEPTGELFFFAIEGIQDSENGYATDYSYFSYSRFTYEYRRLVFRNVDLTNSSLLYLNVYYRDDVSLENPLTFDASTNYPVEITLPIYDSYLGWEDYSQSKALPATLTELVDPPYVYIQDDN